MVAATTAVVRTASRILDVQVFARRRGRQRAAQRREVGTCDDQHERIRRRVEPQTWQAFELLALQRLSGDDGAARLGMPVGSLFAARSKVQRMLREEIARLEQAGGEA